MSYYILLRVVRAYRNVGCIIPAVPVDFNADVFARLAPRKQFIQLLVMVNGRAAEFGDNIPFIDAGLVGGATGRHA